MSQEYKLEGLVCANCATKIEKRIAEIEGFDGVSLNFATQTLSFESQDIEADYAVLLQKEVNRIEDGVVVKRKGDSHHHGGGVGWFTWFRLSLGAILFILGIAVKFPQPTGLIIYLIGYIVIGGDVLWKATRNILRGQVFDENFLMSVATVGAFAIGEYPEAVTVMLFYQIGELFQDMAVQRSRNSIAELMDIRPDVAWKMENGSLREFSAQSIEIGQIIYVKPGERIPLDGVVVNGESMVDTSALTGESVPRRIVIDDRALSGAVNQTGMIEIAVEKLYSDSTVARILELVENATNKKAQTEKFITKFARYYTPIVVYAALALAIIPPLVMEGASFHEWIQRALIFLVISCPCALVISIPLGFFGGVGGASKHGVLIKGSNYLEALNSVDTVVFDKTGTLTKGVFKVTKIDVSDPNITEADFLELAATIEGHSNHPIAKSIIASYGKAVDITKGQEVSEVPGKGMTGVIDGQCIAVGNDKLMKDKGVEIAIEDQHGTIVHLARGSKYLGHMVISDEIKEDSAQAIQALREAGVKKIVMLTGDHKAVGDYVGATLLIDQVYSELLPHEKVEVLESIMAEDSKGKTVFVGDGINDAPVLARADIGVAMGGVGSDAAIEAADVVLMTDEPSKIVDAIKVAKRTRTIVYQNIFFALGVKAIVLVLGAGGLATMWEAVFADVGVALLAIFNAMRIIRRPIK